MTSLKDIDFKSLIAKETNGRMRIRLIALSHIQGGASRTQTAKNLQISRRIVNEWTTRFLKDGLDGLKEKPRTGRPAKLTEKQLKQVKDYVVENNVKPGGGRLMGQDIADYIQSEFGITYGLNNIYRILHSLNFSWITSRSKHPKQSAEVQDEFKKTGI